MDDEDSFRLEIDQARDSSPASSSDVEGEANEESNTATSISHKERSTEPRRSISPFSEPTRQNQTVIEEAVKTRARRPRKLKLTKDGNPLPSLPSKVIKKAALDAMFRLGKKPPTINRESMAALEQATEWFFEQVGEDLSVYSGHAKRRKRIDGSDVWMLMKRQRVLGPGQSLSTVAQDLLSEEVLLDLELPDSAS